ncbi:MAG: response regulator transcription factor [Akkermansiaceae bacterium]
MKNPHVRILLIEDHAVYRNSIIKTLSKHPYYETVDSFSTMEDALESIACGLRADIVLVDLGLPGMDGIKGIPLLRAALPDAKVLVLTAMTTREKVYAAIEAGAQGYLVKSATTARLLATLDEVADGGTPLDPKIAGMILSTFKQLNPIPEPESLAPREREILQLVARGFTKKAVADELGISVHSVTEYIRRIFDKLHVRSLPAAIGAAIRRGLLDLS